jgi:hypothetical protein
VHGDIYVTRLEAALLDSPPMQRLRRVRQLGTTHLVYPGATHTRFSHTLGTMRAAQNLLDAVEDHRSGPHHIPGLLDEWQDAGILQEEFGRATVLARLGALLHDLCHVPLGHTIEDDLKVLTPHDGNGPRFDRLWADLDAEATAAIGNAPGLYDELRMLILSKEGRDPAVDSEYPFVADIVGNTICADLMDYLRRDHLFAGLPFAVGTRFANAFYVMSKSHKHWPGRMVVRVMRDNHQRTDIITELVKYLRYRYELTERVLTHHTKTAADAMIGKLLEMWHDDQWSDVAAAEFPGEATPRRRASVDVFREHIAKAHPEPVPVRRGEQPPPEDAPLGRRIRAVQRIDEMVRDRLEDEFLRRSDDGLLEHLHGVGTGPTADSRQRAIGELATAVLDRRLFKLIGLADTRADRALANEKYQQFGGADVRRQLEERAAEAAGLDHGWQVVIWLPGPAMRLKVAEVLIDDGEGVAPLSRLSDAGNQIVEQHRNLWSIAVYADASLRPANADDIRATRKADVLLAKLHEEMDIRLVRWDGMRVRSLQELAVHTIGEHQRMTEDDRSRLLEIVPAALGTSGRFEELLDRTWRAARENRLVKGRYPRDL